MTDLRGQAVPNSSGIAQPKLLAPAGACDCHMHIYDGERFPPPRPQSRMQTNARVTDYRLLQQRIGTTRTVVVSPAAYGTDNRVTLDAITQLGNARGIAVVHPTITDAEEKQVAFEGIQGVGKNILEPLRTFAAKAESLAWLMRILKELVDEEEYVGELVLWLSKWDTEYAKFIEATYRNTPGAAQMPAGKATAAASPTSSSAISSRPQVRAAGTPVGCADAGTAIATRSRPSRLAS